MSHDMDMFHRAIRHQQSIFKIKILPILRRAVEDLFHKGRVFRMNTLEHTFHGRCRGSVILEDSVGFLRPDDLARGNSPAKTSCVTESLRFRQVRFLALLCTLASDQDTAGILQGDRSQQPGLVIARAHCRPLICFSASFVPSTRARILAKAVSRVVEVLSLKGENPQSSVVPSCSMGMYPDASSTRSQTSSGVSMRGLPGAITPTKTR